MYVLLLMALLIATLLGRRVRKNLEAGGTSVMIPGKRDTIMQPTVLMILDMLDIVQVAYIEDEEIVRRVWTDSRHGFDVPRLLRLVEQSAQPVVAYGVSVPACQISLWMHPAAA
ncbi:MAG: hypothetical protein VB144_14785 [Clostridia bacterium]|nr:hypothetical protein [Clostridia bacterium]